MKILPKQILAILLFLSLITINYHPVKADNNNEVEHLINMVQESHQAQLNLVNEISSREEVLSNLSPYFSTPFIEKLLTEHLLETKYGPMILGTDFSPYFIPFFSYDEKTKVTISQSSKIATISEVFHLFDMDGIESSTGRLTTVYLESRENGWIITNIEMKDVSTKIRKGIHHILVNAFFEA